MMTTDNVANAMQALPDAGELRSRKRHRQHGGSRSFQRVGRCQLPVGWARCTEAATGGWKLGLAKSTKGAPGVLGIDQSVAGSPDKRLISTLPKSIRMASWAGGQLMFTTVGITSPLSGSRRCPLATELASSWRRAS
jgi:hypothetical protein